MPRTSKPLTDAQKAKVEVAKSAMKRAREKSQSREAELRRILSQEAAEDSVAAWKAVWDAAQSGAGPTALAKSLSVSRATIYNYITLYAEHMAGRGQVPMAELTRSPWAVSYASGDEWLLAHPDLGEFKAMFEADDSLTVWSTNGVYKPISRENTLVREGGDWTDELELVYLPLKALWEQWKTAGSPAEWDVEAHAW